LDSASLDSYLSVLTLRRIPHHNVPWQINTCRIHRAAYCQEYQEASYMPQDTTNIAHSGFQPNHAHNVEIMIQLKVGYQKDTCPMPVPPNWNALLNSPGDPENKGQPSPYCQGTIKSSEPRMRPPPLSVKSIPNIDRSSDMHISTCFSELCYQSIHTTQCLSGRILCQDLSPLNFIH